MRMRRWDFVAAYLQGSLEEGEVVYYSLPPGYETRIENGVSVPNLGADGRPRVLRIEKPCYTAWPRRAEGGRGASSHGSSTTASLNTTPTSA
eukprot:4964200-Prymnesium_polylepis.1